MSGELSTLRRTLLAWEKLRLLYSLFVGSFIAWQVGRFPMWGDPGLWNLLVLLLLIFNVFFCLGPLVEAYTLFLTGIECERARILTFGCGSLLAALILVWIL